VGQWAFSLKIKTWAGSAQKNLNDLLSKQYNMPPRSYQKAMFTYLPHIFFILECAKFERASLNYLMNLVSHANCICHVLMQLECHNNRTMQKDEMTQVNYNTLDLTLFNKLHLTFVYLSNSIQKIQSLTPKTTTTTAAAAAAAT